ncbi:MAG: hypothetical protein MJ191_00170 [Clostridium sp.]|nr:hypothetical protein [Clostridium sp.]
MAANKNAQPINETINITTAEAAMAMQNREIVQASARRKELIKYYKSEPQVATYVSPMYRPHFGNVMTVTINGVSIRFPVDGSKQVIPATFADEIERRRRNIDNIERKQKRMAAVNENEDKGSAGSLSLF